MEGLEKLDEWPNKVKLMQKNWIGKSFGCELNFKIEGNNKFKEIKCFTTRPDTFFGMSFLAVSVDHPIAEIYKKIKNLKSLNLIVQKRVRQRNQFLKQKS